MKTAPATRRAQAALDESRKENRSYGRSRMALHGFKQGAPQIQSTEPGIARRPLGGQARRTRRRKKKAAKSSGDEDAGDLTGASSAEANRTIATRSLGAKRRKVYGRDTIICSPSENRVGRISTCAAPFSWPEPKQVSPVDEFDFVGDDEPVQGAGTFAPQTNLLHVLPTLLHLREIGLSHTMKRRHLITRGSKVDNAATGKIMSGAVGGWFSSLALCRPIPVEGNQESVAAVVKSTGNHRWEWRPYVRRSIPFRDLGTHPEDAILALSRDASYMIGLGGARCEGGSPTSDGSHRPILSIRFYGVPSVQSLERHGKSTRRFTSEPNNRSPLLLSIPLLINSIDSGENRNFTAPSLLGESSGSAAANIPVRILTSRDGTLGVVFLLHSLSAAARSPVLPSPSFVESPAVMDEDALGTIFMFPLPGQTPVQHVRSYKCANVRVIGGLRSHTIRNLLWPTRWIPMKAERKLEKEADAWCGSIHESSSGYLLLNDEDDGYRMTWVLCSADIDGFTDAKPAAGYSLCAPPTHSIKAKRSDIITLPDEEVWSEISSHGFTGNITTEKPSQDPTSTGVQIAFEAFFSVEALLSDIFSRRPKFLAGSGTLPDYHYNLISLDDGRTLVLVIVFASALEQQHAGAKKKKPLSVGVFLELDIFNMSYNELSWVKNPSRSDSKFLRHWSNTLALNWRMHERRIGVYSLEENVSSFQSRGVSASNFHESNTGRDELDESSSKKDISMSSLYPFCDLISNDAVISHTPVFKIMCRNSPIELSYK